MPQLTQLIPAGHLRCTCCGAAACAVDHHHGALCPDCLESLAEIQELLDSLEPPDLPPLT